MKSKFYLSKVSDAESLFCNLSELLLDLEHQIGSPELMEEVMTQMFESAAILHPSQTEVFRFFKLFFKDVRELLRSDEKNFYDYKYELSTIESGRFIVDETEGVKYFDHPYHQDYFKQNNNNEKCITVTKSILSHTKE